MHERFTFLKAQWRDLVLLTYPIDAGVLQPLLPPGLRLDEWRGSPLISLVGFRFLRTRILGCRVPFWGSFPEVNLRFYVKLATPQGTRRGVVFIKEFVPYRAVAEIARRVYNENYHAVPMSYGIISNEKVEYRWTVEGRENRMAALTTALPRMPDDDSFETFLLDHHWGYCAQPGGGTKEYEVIRVPWRVYPTTGHELDIDAERLYGAQFARALSQEPISVIRAEGSPIEVSFGRPIMF